MYIAIFLLRNILLIVGFTVDVPSPHLEYRHCDSQNALGTNHTSD